MSNSPNTADTVLSPRPVLRHDAMEAAAPHSYKVIWFFALVFGLFGGAALTLIGLQHYRLVTYVPVQAEILSGSVDVVHGSSTHGGETTSYAPEISYRYTVDGISHTSDSLQPTGNSTASEDWANQLLERYPIGSTVTAYVSPSDPAKSFLDRDVMSFPYVFALLPGLLYSIMIAGTASGQQRSNRVVAASGQWQKLHPSQPVGILFRKAEIAAGLWMGYVVILLGEYVYLLHGKIDLFTIITMLISLGVAAIILWLPWNYYCAMRSYGPVEISAGPGAWKPGGSVDARFSYDARNGAPLQSAAIGIVCLKSQWVDHGKTTQFQSVSMYHVEQPIALLNSSSVATAEVNLPISPEIHATGIEGRKRYPRYDWFVGVRLLAADQPELILRYPIQIDADPPAARG